MRNWWRFCLQFGPLLYIDPFVAANCQHDWVKAAFNRRAHYREAMDLVRPHYGRESVK
ncbi:MAG: hypothetical protein ACYDBT_02290 [Desulfobulbaceae bacterium]